PCHESEACDSRCCSNYEKSRGRPSRSTAQRGAVMTQVILDERADEVVAVIVARLHPQAQRLAGRRAGFLQQFGAEILLEELVGAALVDEDLAGKTPALRDEFAGVVLLPGLAVGTEITRECLGAAPRHARRCDDRGERRQRLVSARILQRDRERTV